ncbi:thioredoxin domain-containing protein 15 [Nephila pilipes]|uniref:Thioredoxin domain-containing protein 15 n=1 Tax=Nephila pilipes TaxID=299642 RepID=A0A8X6UG00_NEPPI|nr:thioredoxin domain-containing protein 15 [Nephila pilipes]
MKYFKVLCFVLFFAVIASEEEEADVTVEFSSHLTDRPIENAKNASIVTSDEIEVRVPYNKEIKNEKLSAVYDIDANATSMFEKNDIVNESNSVQSTETNTTANATDTKSKMKVECTPRIIPEDEIPTVALANSSVLLKVLAPNANKNSTTGDCVVVLFYSNQCVFSARMAPHFNALPRVFPDIAFYAVDVVETGNLYVRYGLVYVPNVMLFHNSKPFARYNETMLNLDQFVKFINKFTGLSHNGTLNVTSADMSGPVPSSLSKKIDYALILAWAFTLCCLCFGFAKSSVCKRAMEFFRNTWQEANATQHEHEE